MWHIETVVSERSLYSDSDHSSEIFPMEHEYQLNMDFLFEIFAMKCCHCYRNVGNAIVKY